MPKTHRISVTVALIVCLTVGQWSEPVFASTEPSASESPATASSANAASETQQLTATPPSRLALGDHTLRAMALSSMSMNGSQPVLASSYAQWGRYRGRGRRNGVAQAEMVLGAVATIAGAAVLTYANRPECRAYETADGCSYGTKVVGTAVTAAGLVTFFTGALTWR
jgi:hypothetical protein